VTATYPENYFPGSEEERQRMADAARQRDAKAEAERVAALPPPQEAPPAIPGLTAAEHAELNSLRAQALSNDERAELDALRAAQGNRPFNA
jgi:hypothetical protein